MFSDQVIDLHRINQKGTFLQLSISLFLIGTNQAVIFVKDTIPELQCPSISLIEVLFLQLATYILRHELVVVNIVNALNQLVLGDICPQAINSSVGTQNISKDKKSKIKSTCGPLLNKIFLPTSGVTPPFETNGIKHYTLVFMIKIVSQPLLFYYSHT